MPKKPYDPCKVNACKIQSCLRGKFEISESCITSSSFLIFFSHLQFIPENSYQEEKCLEVLEEMRQCCIKWKSQSLCCSGIDIEKKPEVTKKDQDKQTN